MKYKEFKNTVKVRDLPYGSREIRFEHNVFHV